MPLLMPTWYWSLLIWFFFLFAVLATWIKAVILPHQVALQWTRWTLLFF